MFSLMYCHFCAVLWREKSRRVKRRQPTSHPNRFQPLQPRSSYPPQVRPTSSCPTRDVLECPQPDSDFDHHQFVQVSVNRLRPLPVNRTEWTCPQPLSWTWQSSDASSFPSGRRRGCSGHCSTFITGISQRKLVWDFFSHRVMAGKTSTAGKKSTAIS